MDNSNNRNDDIDKISQQDNDRRVRQRNNIADPREHLNNNAPAGKCFAFCFGC